MLKYSKKDQQTFGGGPSGMADMFDMMAKRLSNIIIQLFNIYIYILFLKKD